MRSILGGKKCALMVVKPPGNFWRTGIFEINDCILVAVKLLFIEQRPGAMQQAWKDELNMSANPLPVESREQRSRRSPMKTPVEVENANSQAFTLQCD